MHTCGSVHLNSCIDDGYVWIQGSTESVMSYYSAAGEVNYGKIAVTGEIQFGINYNPKTSNLEVTIRRCKDLATADTKKNRSDPLVLLLNVA